MFPNFLNTLDNQDTNAKTLKISNKLILTKFCTKTFGYLKRGFKHHNFLFLEI